MTKFRKLGDKISLTGKTYTSSKIETSSTRQCYPLQINDLHTVHTAAEDSAKYDGTLLVISHATFQQHILPNTSAEYSAGDKCATCGLLSY